MLDLGGEREPDRALAPLEQVGEAAVGDDDVGQRMRGERDGGARGDHREQGQRDGAGGGGCCGTGGTADVGHVGLLHAGPVTTKRLVQPA